MVDCATLQCVMTFFPSFDALPRVLRLVPHQPAKSVSTRVSVTDAEGAWSNLPERGCFRHVTCRWWFGLGYFLVNQSCEAITKSNHRL